MIELGYSSKLNAEWEFLSHAARRGPPRGRRRSCARMATTSAGARPLDLDALLEGV